VAYLEPGKRLLITLGYRDDEKAYPVKLHTIHLGKIDMKAGDFHALEASTSKHRNIICHELYVAGEDDFTMVLTTHEAPIPLGPFVKFVVPVRAKLGGRLKFSVRAALRHRPASGLEARSSSPKECKDHDCMAAAQPPAQGISQPGDG
jgi:hypothetical protein